MPVSGEGVVAAGHPLSAQAGARALREGGNAVDAALAALLTACVAEPLLTGLGAGGYLVVGGAGLKPRVIDFFPAVPRRPAQVALRAVEVSFGDAVQTFHIGPASCAVYGTPAGIALASKRFGRLPLAALCEPAAALAERGVELNRAQAYVFEILADLVRQTPEAAALYLRDGRPLAKGERFRSEELARSLRLLGAQGADPFYTGSIGRAVRDHLASVGGSWGEEDLAGYRAIVRAPLAVPYRGLQVLTNPPPAAGGILLAYSLLALARRPGPPDEAAIVAALEAAQARRDAAFLRGLRQAGYAKRFLRGGLGGTTHVSAIDRDGLACAMTTTNGEGSAVVVPGTGIHINNVLGEADLNPEGFLRHPPGTRPPSMLAPTLVVGERGVEAALGSAGSNRIRSAILQCLVNLLDRGLGVEEALLAPRLHVEEGVVYHEPGLSLGGLGKPTVPFRARNLYFGGVQAVVRRDGRVEGAGDPRRGGAAAAA